MFFTFAIKGQGVYEVYRVDYYSKEIQIEGKAYYGEGGYREIRDGFKTDWIKEASMLLQIWNDRLSNGQAYNTVNLAVRVEKESLWTTFVALRNKNIYNVEKFQVQRYDLSKGYENQRNHPIYKKDGLSNRTDPGRIHAIEIITDTSNNDVYIKVYCEDKIRIWHFLDKNVTIKYE